MSPRPLPFHLCCYIRPVHLVSMILRLNGPPPRNSRGAEWLYSMYFEPVPPISTSLHHSSIITLIFRTLLPPHLFLSRSIYLSFTTCRVMGACNGCSAHFPRLDQANCSRCTKLIALPQPCTREAREAIIVSAVMFLVFG